MQKQTRTLTCYYCNKTVHQAWQFFGKQIKVCYKCPKCGQINEYALQPCSDKIFLRFGFFMNPLYLPAKYYFEGAPFKWFVAAYPFTFILFLITNIIYMPFGLIYNNLKIHRSNKRFYQDNESADIKLIYYGNLRQLADSGDHYAALLVGKDLLYGGAYAQNTVNALHYLTFAGEKYSDAHYELGEYMFKNNNFTEAFTHFNQSKKHKEALYKLAYLYTFGKGVTKSTRLAKIMLFEALELGASDEYLLKDELM